MTEERRNAAGELVCRCGHDKRHFWVRPAYHYGLLGSLAQVMGMSVVPSRIDLKCGVCNETVAAITEPGLLHKFRAREPRPEER
jgi:hypothetical protein